MNITINNKNYVIEKGYQDNEKLRRAHDLLSQTVYKLSFEKWYSLGYWPDSCIPYTLFDGKKAISSIMVSIMHIMHNGKVQIYIQLGTVMTDKDYRNQGLSRFMIENIVGEFARKVDGIFLFANDNVLNFYPKFGFVKEQEYNYSASVVANAGKLRKLSMDSKDDRSLILESVKKGNPFADFTVLDKYTMFHCTMFYTDCLFYLEDLEVVAICKNEEETLYCYDIFGDCKKDLNAVLSAVASTESKTVVLGFTPADKCEFDTTLSVEEDTTLFVLESGENPFRTEKLKFPVLSHT